MNLKRKGILLVVAGPSGVGKGTLIAGLRERHPEVLLSVSCTTRARRPGETEGGEYFFRSREEFEALRDRGELLEWAEVYPGLFYGTPRAPVEEALAAGQDLILEVDDEGAQSVQRLLPEDARLVFVAPPDYGALHNRLVARGTETPDQLRERLRTACEEISDLGAYRYVIVNDQIPEAVAALEGILLAERSSLRVVEWQALQAELLTQAEACEVTGDGG
ncbi:MAG TPA: guanylate kinase [Armatimonadota bacterium]|jgi:guanylate kinase